MILIVCPNPSIDKFLDIPIFKAGGVNKSLHDKAYPGGKGVHVALAVKELGQKCMLTGFWGGPTGQWIQDECSKSDISCYGPKMDGWTRTCLTIKSDPDSHDTEIREQGPQVTVKELDELYKDIESHLSSVRALCVSGSWPPGTPDHVYDDLKEMTRTSGIPLWVDASGDRLREAIKAKPYGIHINRKEAETLLGYRKNTVDYTSDLLEYCTIAAVTDGAKGLYLARAETALHAYCTVENVISTVGCGDCLLAGLIVSEFAGGDLEDMARTGTACGAANCVNPELGMLLNKDVQQFKRQTTCKKVKIDYEEQ